MAGGVVTVSEHELSEIRGLIETRSGILFDDSRERFFSTRVLEHVEARKLSHGTDLLRLIKNSNVEYDRRHHSSAIRQCLRRWKKRCCPTCT
jgi:chemotaxis methyl-accepting protein methylase